MTNYQKLIDQIFQQKEELCNKKRKNDEETILFSKQLKEIGENIELINLQIEEDEKIIETLENFDKKIAEQNERLKDGVGDTMVTGGTAYVAVGLAYGIWCLINKIDINTPSILLNIIETSLTSILFCIVGFIGIDVKRHITKINELIEFKKENDMFEVKGRIIENKKKKKNLRNSEYKIQRKIKKNKEKKQYLDSLISECYKIIHVVMNAEKTARAQVKDSEEFEKIINNTFDNDKEIQDILSRKREKNVN